MKKLILTVILAMNVVSLLSAAANNEAEVLTKKAIDHTTEVLGKLNKIMSSEMDNVPKLKFHYFTTGGKEDLFEFVENMQEQISTVRDDASLKEFIKKNRTKWNSIMEKLLVERFKTIKTDQNQQEFLKQNLEAVKQNPINKLFDFLAQYQDKKDLQNNFEKLKTQLDDSSMLHEMPVSLYYTKIRFGLKNITPKGGDQVKGIMIRNTDRSDVLEPGLRLVGEDIRKEVEAIYLNNNKIEKIPAGIFQRFPNVKYIYLVGNNISSIERNAFKDLMYLERIILGNNKIEKIADEAFVNLPSLKIISLMKNPIKEISSKSFVKVNPQVNIKGAKLVNSK